MAHLKNLSSQYQAWIPLYDEIPKSVFAAIAFSMCFIDMQEDKIGGLTRMFEEWQALYDNGIVKQKPPTRLKVAKAIADKGGA